MKANAYLNGLSNELKNSAFFEDVCDEPKKCGRKKINKTRKSGVTSIIMIHAKRGHYKTAATAKYVNVIIMNNTMEVWGSFVFNNIPVC